MFEDTLLTRYKAYLRAAGTRPGTIRLRMIQLRRIATLVGPLLELSNHDLITWLGSHNWAPETRRSQRAALSGFYRWAVDEELLPVSPARRLPVVKVPAGTPRPAPDHRLAHALTDATDRDRIMLGLGGFAGLRRMEIAGIAWDDVTWSGLRIRGKGGRVRLVPLLPELRRELEAERARREAGTWGTGWRFAVDPMSPYVLPGQDGYSAISADCVGRTLARLLGEGWTGHTLRHRFATSAYAVERDLLTVQQLLGHSRPETTARYTAVPAGAAMRAVEGSTLPPAA